MGPFVAQPDKPQRISMEHLWRFGEMLERCGVDDTMLQELLNNCQSELSVETAVYARAIREAYYRSIGATDIAHEIDTFSDDASP